MTDFFQKQIKEIQNSEVLKIYGAFLGLTHVLTFFYWNLFSFFVNSQSHTPLCYPFFPNCDLLQHLMPTTFWSVILLFYLFVSLFSIWFFLDKNQIKKAYFLLILATFIKLTLYLSNYNFTNDYHFMVHLVLFVYFFIPHKKSNIQYLISAFYVTAGFSKINPDWLTASTVVNISWINNTSMLPILVYVIFFGIFMVPSLLFAPRWFCWLTLLQLLILQIAACFTMELYDSLLALCLISFFFVDEFFDFLLPVLKQSFNPKIFIKALFKPKTNIPLKSFFKGKEKSLCFHLPVYFYFFANHTFGSCQ